MNKKYITVLLLYFLCFTMGIGQQCWKDVNFLKKNILESNIQAKNALYKILDIEKFKQKTLEEKSNKPLKIYLPFPNNSLQEFIILPNNTMSISLQEKYPTIKTYSIKSTTDNACFGTLDITPKGIHAMIFSREGTIFIDPLFLSNNTNYIVYYKKDFVTKKQASVCNVSQDKVLNHPLDLSITHKEQNIFNQKASNGLVLKNYRAAISATGEYTQFHGGSVLDGLAAVITTINRVNSIYERDLAISLTLVDDNDLIIYTDPLNDPFTNPSNAFIMHGENATSINSTIGLTNYDIGHVLGTDGSGLASAASVCTNNRKAFGTTGIITPVGDPFDVDYVAHEIGHQFGAMHTFNGNAASCSSNIFTTSAYEPGSGSTIMAYAGICAPQNIQQNSSAYFHTHSLEQIKEYTTQGFGATCPTNINTLNDTPIINIISPSNTFLPISTPFELEASATDNSQSILTYCWEEFDLGPPSDPNSPTSTAPLFRSFPPSEKGLRTFPQIDDIVTNSQTLGEILPSYSRDLSFKITVRDNIIGGAAYTTSDVLFYEVSDSAGPFLVNVPNTSLIWNAGDFEGVEWDPANTDIAPVNCLEVDIFLSTDGGFTYPYLLASNIPNNGYAVVPVPTVSTSLARVKIKSSNNIFFDISDENFTIELNCANVNTDINISVQDSFYMCEQESTNLFLSSIQSDLEIVSYQWQFNGTNINGANDSVLYISSVNNSNIGTYTCLVGNVCNTVLSPPIYTTLLNGSPMPVYLYSQNDTIFSSVLQGNHWYLDGILLPNETNYFISSPGAGVYETQINAGSCSSISSPFTYVSIKDLNTLGWQLFPNPFKDEINIVFEKEEQYIEIATLDHLGKTIMKDSYRNIKKIQLNLKELAKGMYYIIIRNNLKKTVSFKVLKQ